MKNSYQAVPMTHHHSNRLLKMGILAIVALTANAQQTVTGAAEAGKDDQGQLAAQNEVPNLGEMIGVLTRDLDLTAGQQAKITPILEELHDTQRKLAQDKSLSREERLVRVRPLRYEANRQIREILNDDQKRKLDEYLQGPHPEMHGSLSGVARSQ